MAVANSAMLRIPGRSSRPASRYAKGIALPAWAAARPGSRKKPELSVAPVAMAYTSNSPSSRFSLGMAAVPGAGNLLPSAAESVA